MPKRSDREVFSGVFGSNPFQGMSPEEIYTEIQWGNTPKEVIDISAPESLIALGHLAKLVYTSGSAKFEKNDYNLAIGSDSNILYIFPVGETYIPDLDDSLWFKVKVVKETHYYSDKGGEDCYYYHNHEKPYPILFSREESPVHIIVPQKFKGQRSYAVIKEGIVG
jgi:hypothetical protein